VNFKKKLIEVALPLAAINAASTREKSIRHGHPSTLHLWWARRPLATARAVLFAQLVDDPSEHTDIFKSQKAQEKERQRLFRIIEELVKWESTSNEIVLQRARDEIWQSWRYTCAENADHPQARELFDRYKLPSFHDPFAGGGAIPLEAQRLGLEAYGTDLNPVAVLINKAMIEVPPHFSGRSPVNPLWTNKTDSQKAMTQWSAARGIADDVLYYGQWMRDEAHQRIGHLYPEIEITAEMAAAKPHLEKYAKQRLTVIAWLWVRTVKSPNPAFSNIDVPLASTFTLSTKPGKEVNVEPVLDTHGYRFTLTIGETPHGQKANAGTKLSRANFQCLMSGAPISGDYIKAEGKAGRMGARLVAIVAEGHRERVFLEPTPESEALAKSANPTWKPEAEIHGSTQYIGVKPYGMTHFSDLFTLRQLVALTTFSDLVQEAREKVLADIRAANLPHADLAREATDYADAIALYLAIAVDKAADYWSTLCFWHNGAAHLKIVNTFGRQALSMSWDFAEANPFSISSGHFLRFISLISEVLNTSVPAQAKGFASQKDAAGTCNLPAPEVSIVSTDPPYFDNVPYADLSDFFYVWLRRSLKPSFPLLFATLESPKDSELVAFAYRHENKAAASEFFMNGMTNAMRNLAEEGHPAFPVTIYYAFRQSETESEGTASTGWETFLEAVIAAGFGISGTWPMRTEYTGNLKTNRNALASSIILVCRRRDLNAPTATRRDFATSLKAELPLALAHLQRGNIAPVDLAQAAIGPGMGVYTRYSKVLDAEGKSLSVRDALALINHTLDEALAEQEGDFDADSRWALTWFEQNGFSEGEYGVAEQLSKSKNTSVTGLVAAGIVTSRPGKVRLLKPGELPGDWDPAKDARLTVWEMVHQLIRVLEASGEASAAVLAHKLEGKAEAARELCYRLYTLCERKKRSADAMAYNSLVLSWPEISRLARETNVEIGKPQTNDMFAKE
jgi:putative DNA methylase